MGVLETVEVPFTATPAQLLRLVATVLGLSVLGVVSHVIYNIFFHPLSSYPGPKAWAGTRLFAFWYATRGDLVHQIRRLHEKYGPVVRIAPTELSYTTGSAWKTIYGHRSVEMPKVMDGRGGILPPPNGGHSIITANRQDHSRLRRNVAHAFSEKALRDQESYIQDYVTQLISTLKQVTKTTETTQDMSEWYNFTTFDIIGDLAFGEPFGCLESNTFHSWVSGIFNSIRSTPWIQFGLYYKISKRIMPYIVPYGLVQARSKNWRISGEKMDRRMANTEDRKDFTSYMLKHQDERGLTTQELRNMAPILIIAGSETTATLLTGATFYMLKNRHTYDRLAKEVRETFASEDEITMVEVNKLKYMLAVLEEGLRMHPPVPTILPRAVPGQGEEIDGKWVPGNTAVGVHQFATYMSEANFHKATGFHPERWLPEAEGGSPEFATDDKAAFQPFSAGPRNCVGKNLAYAEMRLIMARLLFNFDLELDAASDRWNEKKAPFLWERTALMVKLTPRH